MYKLLKKIYYLIPGKKYIFLILKLVWTPAKKTALYLKFKGVVSFKINGNKYKITNKNTAIETLLFWHGIESHEPISMKCWSVFSKESKIVFDIGSNTGIYSLVTDSCSKKKALIYGFEPLPRISNLYIQNMELNNVNAISIQNAVSDKNGNATFYDMDSYDNQIGSLKEDHVKKHQHATNVKPIKVDIVTIDSFVSERNIQNVDLVKIDVEGVEDKALLGMKKTIENHTPVILIEISNSETANNVNDFLNKISVNYKLFEINEAEGLKSKVEVSKSNAFNYLLCPNNKIHLIKSMIND